jgi:tRNA (guanine9-N1)-methyltransferase
MLYRKRKTIDNLTLYFKKCMCLRKAEEQGIATARLPIGEFIQMSTRKILAVNHVFEILLNYLDSRDWNQAFLAVIPERKFKKNN